MDWLWAFGERFEFLGIGAWPILAWFALGQGYQEETVVEALCKDGKGPEDGAGNKDVPLVGWVV